MADSRQPAQGLGVQDACSGWLHRKRDGRALHGICPGALMALTSMPALATRASSSAMSGARLAQPTRWLPCLCRWRQGLAAVRIVWPVGISPRSCGTLSVRNDHAGVRRRLLRCCAVPESRDRHLLVSFSDGIGVELSATSVSRSKSRLAIAKPPSAVCRARRRLVCGARGRATAQQERASVSTVHVLERRPLRIEISPASCASSLVSRTR